MYSFNWNTGDFEIDFSYYERAYMGDIENGETEEISEQEFNAYVEKLRKQGGL